VTLTVTTGRRKHAPGQRALPRPLTGQGPIATLLAPLLLFILLGLAGAWSWGWLAPGIRQLIRTEEPTGPASAAASGNQQLAPIFTPQVIAWTPDILRWSNNSGLDPNLVAVVMQIESCGDPRAVSPSGALGLFQVMPAHFDLTENPLDPETNARRALAYLSGGLALAHGDSALALAGYNGGHSLISAPLNDWPEETRRYVAWGSGILNDIAGHRTPSPTLERWLEAGGDRLCRSADIARAAN
jgi:Transglycosylase SLT domain